MQKFISRKKSKGFTLVELIVVITILSILGTIGFISIQGFSSSARDSARVSDIGKLSRAIEMRYLRAGAYPNPDTSFTITYSGGIVWTE